MPTYVNVSVTPYFDLWLGPSRCSSACTSDNDVTQANVVGATRRFFERIQLVGGIATSTVQDASYIVPESSTVGANIAGGDILKVDAHYTFDASFNPPKITSLDSVAMPDGVYDLEFEYSSRFSRNNLAQGISNRVDVFIKGQRPTPATETMVFNNTRQFNTVATSPYYRSNFLREDETNPVAGNFFMPFALSPVIDASTTDTIIINGITYNENVHYWLINDYTGKGLAPKSLAGIEIRSVANGSSKVDPPHLGRFVVNYVYNSIPRTIENNIRQHLAVSKPRCLGT